MSIEVAILHLKDALREHLITLENIEVDHPVVIDGEEVTSVYGVRIMKSINKLAKQYRWEKISNNYALRIDPDHYISYNPDTGSSHFGALLDTFIGESGEETALVDDTNPEHKFRILRGDWRDEYERRVPLGFEACLDFFMENRRQHGGQWSTHEKDRADLRDARKDGDAAA